MSVKGFFKGLGKVALKAAPYAALAIPGVGPVAAMGIRAGIGAAQGAASGKGLKGALIGGGLGAIPVPGGGGAVATTFKEGLKQAGKQAVKETLSNVAGQVAAPSRPAAGRGSTPAAGRGSTASRGGLPPYAMSLTTPGGSTVPNVDDWWNYGMDDTGVGAPESGWWDYGMDDTSIPPPLPGRPTTRAGMTLPGQTGWAQPPAKSSATNTDLRSASIPPWLQDVLLGGGIGLDYLQRRGAANVSKEQGENLAKASEYAANLIRDAQKEALAFQREQWEGTQARMQPFVDQGTWAVNTLGQLMGNPGGQSRAGAAPAQSTAGPDRASATPTMSGFYGG
jgi:hypothetical protein